MELKFGTGDAAPEDKGVLIVPLWNWNKSEFEKEVLAYEGSNCTFMELKWRYLLLGKGHSHEF